MLSRKIMQYSLKFSPLYGSNTLTGSYDLNPSSPWLDHCTDQTACPLPSFSLGVGEEGKNVCPAAWRLWESLYQFTGRLFLHFRWLGPQTSSTLLLQEFFEFSWMWMSNSLFPADTQIPSLLTPPPPHFNYFFNGFDWYGQPGQQDRKNQNLQIQREAQITVLNHKSNQQINGNFSGSTEMF